MKKSVSILVWLSISLPIFSFSVVILYKLLFLHESTFNPWLTAVYYLISGIFLIVVALLLYRSFFKLMDIISKWQLQEIKLKNDFALETMHCEYRKINVEGEYNLRQKVSKSEILLKVLDKIAERREISDSDIEKSTTFHQNKEFLDEVNEIVKKLDSLCD